MSDYQRVAGQCPMGCGETLFLGEGGHVTCSFVDCSAPTAVTDLLHDAQPHHLVQFDENGFSVMHPLHERLEGLLWECPLDQRLRELTGPPFRLGRYRAMPDGAGRWHWDEVTS